MITLQCINAINWKTGSIWSVRNLLSVVWTGRLSIKYCVFADGINSLTSYHRV